MVNLNTTCSATGSGLQQRPREAQANRVSTQGYSLGIFPDFNELWSRNIPNRDFVFYNFRQTPVLTKSWDFQNWTINCTKKCLKGPVAVRTQIFKTSTADLINTDPQLLQCIATDDYCIYKQKQILQVKKVRIYWYHMRICNKMSSIKKPKKIQAQKVQSGVLEQRHDWLTKFLLTPLQILVCKLRHLLETKH